MKSTTHSHVKNRHWSLVSSPIKMKELEQRWKWDSGIVYQILKIVACLDGTQGPMSYLSHLLPVFCGKRT